MKKVRSQRSRRCGAKLSDRKIKEHRGRIVKTTGDGLLVEFGSVVDAVRCAVDVQREMAVRNAAVPAERNNLTAVIRLPNGPETAFLPVFSRRAGMPRQPARRYWTASSRRKR